MSSPLDGEQPHLGEHLEPVEQVVLAIWAAELGINDITPDEDFFDLGGHSLKAVVIASEVERRLGVPVPLRDFYQHSTVRGHAQLVVAARLGPDAGSQHTEEQV